MAGVFERHTTLKCVLTEQQGIDWVPETLEQLDRWFTASKSPAFGNERYHAKTFAAFSMKPSEYFRRNCYLGASFLTPREVPCLPQVGVDRVMWGSDYPHAEGTFPYTRQALRDPPCRPFRPQSAGDPGRDRAAGLRDGPGAAAARGRPHRADRGRGGTAAAPGQPGRRCRTTRCRVFAREPVWV